MNRKIQIFAIVCFVLISFACSRGKGNDVFVAQPSPPLPSTLTSSPYKVKVVDVSNDAHAVFDVDVIGLLWSGLEDSLKKRGMLWNEKTGGTPYTIEAHVVSYQKGSMGARWMPYAGDTSLVVKCEVKNDGRQIAALESKHKITFGKGTFTRGAWRKVFEEVSEDLVTQAAKHF